jgi:hypothetical protein
MVKSGEVSYGNNEFFYKAVLLALIFLTRVDYLFTVIPLLVLSDFIITPKQYRKKYLMYSLISLLIVATMYFSVNYFFFKEFLPVTARVKNTLPETLLLHNIGQLLEPGAFTNQFAKAVYTLGVIFLFLIISLKSKFRKTLNKTDYFLFGLCCASFLYLFVNTAINRQGLKEWYVAFPAFVSTLLLVRIILLFPKMYYPSLTIFVLMFSFMLYVTRIENPKWNSNYNYAKEIKKYTAPDDRIFMIDMSGIIGFFSERKLINGDGLINSYEYHKYLSSDNLTQYFIDKKIDYYSTYSQVNPTFEMIDSAGYYIDGKYAGAFRKNPFVFPHKNLILRQPHYYSYIIGDGTGTWYLFKFNN